MNSHTCTRLKNKLQKKILALYYPKGPPFTLLSFPLLTAPTGNHLLSILMDLLALNFPNTLIYENNPSTHICTFYF